MVLDWPRKLAKDWNCFEMSPSVFSRMICFKAGSSSPSNEAFRTLRQDVKSRCPICVAVKSNEQPM